MKITRKIRQHDCMIPRSTTNKQCGIQMCLKWSLPAWDIMSLCSTRNTVCVLSTLTHLVIRSWSTAKYLGFIQRESPCSSPHRRSYLKILTSEFLQTEILNKSSHYGSHSKHILIMFLHIQSLQMTVLLYAYLAFTWQAPTHLLNVNTRSVLSLNRISDHCKYSKAQHNIITIFIVAPCIL